MQTEGHEGLALFTFNSLMQKSNFPPVAAVKMYVQRQISNDVPPGAAVKMYVQRQISNDVPPGAAVKMYVQRQISNDVPPGATIKLLKHGIKIEIKKNKHATCKLPIRMAHMCQE